MSMEFMGSFKTKYLIMCQPSDPKQLGSISLMPNFVLVYHSKGGVEGSLYQ